MTALRDRLRAGDPAANDAGLETTALARMRQAIVTTPAPARNTGFNLAAPLAAALLCATAGSAWFIQSAPSDLRQAAAPPEKEPAHVRQVQFSTAGGTRLIWFFNPDFDVR